MVAVSILSAGNCRAAGRGPADCAGALEVVGCERFPRRLAADLIRELSEMMLCSRVVGLSGGMCVMQSLHTVFWHAVLLGCQQRQIVHPLGVCAWHGGWPHSW